MVERQAQRHDAASESYVTCGGVRLIVYAAEAEDGRLWEVDDWRESVDAERAETRDRERAALQVFRRESPSAGFLDQLASLPSDVEHRLAMCVAHDGDQQALSGIDGDADVNLVEDLDGVFLPSRVEQRMFSQSECCEFNEAVGDRRDQRFARAFELLAKLDERGHIDLGCERDRGGLLQAGDHAISDCASQRCNRDRPSVCQ